MKLTLESTPEIFTMAPGIKYRIWKGVTDRGVRVEVLATHVVALPGQDESLLDELAEYPADWQSAFQNQADFYPAEYEARVQYLLVFYRRPQVGEERIT